MDTGATSSPSWITRSTSSGLIDSCSGPIGRVCLLAATYAQVIGTAGTILEGLSDGELAAVMGANATRIYGL